VKQSQEKGELDVRIKDGRKDDLYISYPPLGEKKSFYVGKKELTT